MNVVRKKKMVLIANTYGGLTLYQAPFKGFKCLNKLVFTRFLGVRCYCHSNLQMRKPRRRGLKILFKFTQVVISNVIFLIIALCCLI